jgi:hypothetical protein
LFGSPPSWLCYLRPFGSLLLILVSLLHNSQGIGFRVALQASWKNVLSFVSSSPELSLGQKAQLQQIAELLTPALYEGRDPERRARLLRATKETATFLSPAQYKALYLTLGQTSGPGIEEPLRVRAMRYVQDKLVLLAGEPMFKYPCAGGDCTCHLHHGEDDCGASACNDVVVPLRPCDSSFFGCGLFGIETCDGCCATA